jgi:hypothetical protein
MMGLVVAILLVCAGFGLCAVLLLSNMAESLERIADAAEAAAVDLARAAPVVNVTATPVVGSPCWGAPIEGGRTPAPGALDAWGAE